MEWFEFVEIFVIQCLEEGFRLLLEYLEVDSKTCPIEFLGRYRNIYLPVMSMQVFAFTLVILEIVG